MQSATALLAAAGAVGANLVFAQLPASAASRTFDFSYTAIVRSLPADAGRVEVWLPYPQTDAHQTIHRVRVSASAPVEIAREPEYGNEAIHLVFEKPAAQEIPIVVSFIATRRDYVRALTPAGTTAESPGDLARFLKPDRLVPIDGRIREMALQVTKGKRTDLEKARAIYEHVTLSMKYDKSGEGWGRGDALWACDSRRGNCTDFHSVLIGMARAVGIPAKFAIGFPLPAERGEGEIPGYHCWAELYVKGIGWVPVDSSEASKHPEKREYFFGAHDENRVQLSVGRDLALRPRQKGDPLNYFVYPYVEVDGQAYTAVDKKFAFHDMAPAAAVSR
jgi:transglutaminase-like putative cysteine protease